MIIDIRCPICGPDGAFEELKLRRFLPTKSRNPELLDFKNVYCKGCGLVSIFPRISDLSDYYNKSYRASDNAIQYKGKLIEPVLQMPWSGHSFKRFQNFLTVADGSGLDISSLEGGIIIDIGGYNGMFLSAFSNFIEADFRVSDFNISGIEFAQKCFSFDNSSVIKDINTFIDSITEPVDMFAMVHSFEHLYDPDVTLSNIKKKLTTEGLLYIEVPNALATPLDDPTHIYMYSSETLQTIVEANGFKILSKTYSDIPRGAFDGYYASEKQNICVLAANIGERKKFKFLPPIGGTNPTKEIQNGHRAVMQENALFNIKKGFRLFRRSLLKLFYSIILRG